MYLYLYHPCYQIVVFLGIQHQMGKHVGKTTDIKGMVRMVVVAIIITIMRVMLMAAMAIDFGLKNKPSLVRTIVVMVRHNGVHKNDCTCQSNHYFCSQMLHCMTFTGDIMVLSNAVSLCKNT